MTRQSDYGVVLLTHIVQSPATQTHSARDLAERSRFSLPMVTKILKMLARAGFLTSQRGAKGGYRLELAPDEISVADIIRILEGPIALTACIVDAPGDCEHEPGCLARGPLQKINQAIRSALESVKLSDLAEPASLELAGVLSSGPELLTH